MAKKKKLDHKELERRCNFLSDLMDHIPDVIYFKDNNGKLLMVNKAHARGLGLHPSEVVGKTDFDFFSEERAEAMSKDDAYVLKTGKPLMDKIERATRPDGVDNYVSTTKIPRYDDKGKIKGLIGITRDITSRRHIEILQDEKKHIEEKLHALEELNNMKSEFISVVSHELRTPLAIIKEAVSLIYDNVVGPINERQKDLLLKAKKHIQHLKSIIDDLLDITRIDKKKLKLHYSLVNLNDIFKDTSGFFKDLAKEKNIHLEYDLPEGQINVFIDAERINQVISNLISNAIKFTEQNGEIKVEVCILKNVIRVGVIDTGIGVSEEDLPNLFGKFTQFSKKPGAERKGIGLGLSIVKAFVETHGGEVWAKSRLGVGTRMYFTLPRFYTTTVLDKNRKEEVNVLLSRGVPLYLINLLIVNFKEFRQRINVKPRELFKDIRDIINTTSSEFKREDLEPSGVIHEDYSKGEWGMLLPDVTENKANEICSLFRDRINKYFQDNKVEKVFINLGLASYSPKETHSEVKHLPAKIDIKTIYIRSGVREFERVSFNTIVEIGLLKDRKETAQTVDISEGGLCFITHRQFRVGDKIKIRLKFPNRKEGFEIKGCVAWIDMEQFSKASFGQYRVGLEFRELEDREKSMLSKLVRLVSKR